MAGFIFKMNRCLIRSQCSMAENVPSVSYHQPGRTGEHDRRASSDNVDNEAAKGQPSSPNGNTEHRCKSVPEFRRLEVSDTGYYIPPGDAARILKPGDHIAWLRCWKYYKHAIVVENSLTACGDRNNSFTVVEKSCTGKIDTKDRKEYLQRSSPSCLGCWPGHLFKVYYPDSVQIKHPANIVVNTARSKVDQRMCCKSDEDFAAQTKVDCHQITSSCGPCRKKIVGCLPAAFTKVILKLLRLLLLVVPPEIIEKCLGGDDAIAAALMIVEEIIILFIFSCLIYREIARFEEYIENEPPIRVRKKRVYAKAICKFPLLLTMTILIGICGKNLLYKFTGRPRSPWKFIIEVSFGLFGAIIGEVLGLIFFVCLPYKICLDKCLGPQSYSESPSSSDSVQNLGNQRTEKSRLEQGQIV